MNLGPATSGGDQCVGAIFDLGPAMSGGNQPGWVFGDTFLVCNFITLRWHPTY